MSVPRVRKSRIPATSLDLPEGEVLQLEDGGSAAESATQKAFVPGGPVGTDDTYKALADQTLSAFAFEGNYPNPFHGQTTLRFALPEATEVTLSVYDVRGRKVATLVEEELPAGTHDITWQGRGRNGQALASGLYFARLDAGEHTALRRLTLVR